MKIISSSLDALKGRGKKEQSASQAFLMRVYWPQVPRSRLR